jgi:hypothetical protein
MKNLIVLAAFLIVNIVSPAQNRFYAGLTFGGTVCFSNYVDMNPPSPYVAIKNSYTLRYGIPIFWQISRSIFVETGIRFVPTNIHYIHYQQSYSGRQVGVNAFSGYNSFQIPLYIGKNLKLGTASYGNYSWFLKGGAIYTSTQNTEFSTGFPTPYPDPLTRGFHNVNWMVYAGTGLLLVFNNDNRLSLTFGYSHGFRTIFQEHVNSKVIASKGSNLELSFCYSIPISKFLPKKWRNKIVSEKTTNNWYKFFYLPDAKQKKQTNEEENTNE